MYIKIESNKHGLFILNVY